MQVVFVYLAEILFATGAVRERIDGSGRLTSHVGRQKQSSTIEAQAQASPSSNK